ncbi:MAG: transglutaminase domain-containing protein, partial [Bacteroidota bacterium]
YRYFLLSSLKSWQEVNQWAQSVFALKSEPNLDAVFKEIFTGKETTDDKINKIINYVQDEIRYMGNEAGLGSIKPRSPEEVIKKRYGDCKDKSLLLVSLLKKIGINESYPALVNTQIQHEIDKLGPGTEIFNHCIVTFNYNGETYWIDPSVPMQGGDFKDMFITDYGKALVVGLSTDSLQTMSSRKTNAYSDIVEEITVTSFTKPAQLKTISTRYGYDADLRRILLEYYSTSNLLDDLSKELKLLFPVVNKTSEMAVVDNVEKNEISTTYTFEVDGFWRDGDKEKNEATQGLWIFNYEPMLLYYYFTKSACEGREFDAALNYPVNLNYHVTFNCPKEILIMDNYYANDNESFFFEQKIEQLSSKSFRIDYKIKTKANYIKAKDYKKICEEKNKIVDKLPIAIYFTK